MTGKKTGRPLGSKNKRTLLVEQLGGKEGEDELWSRICEQAREGKDWAVKMVAERLYKIR